MCFEIRRRSTLRINFVFYVIKSAKQYKATMEISTLRGLLFVLFLACFISGAIGSQQAGPYLEDLGETVLLKGETI